MVQAGESRGRMEERPRIAEAAADRMLPVERGNRPAVRRVDGRPSRFAEGLPRPVSATAPSAASRSATTTERRTPLRLI